MNPVTIRLVQIQILGNCIYVGHVFTTASFGLNFVLTDYTLSLLEFN